MKYGIGNNGGTYGDDEDDDDKKNSLKKGLKKKEAESPKAASASWAAPKGSALSGASTAKPSSFKNGGKVKKTGVALVHKNEVVLTKKQAKKDSNRKSSSHKRVAGK